MQNWRDQSYLLSVFRMMSEDGSGGESKVLWGFEESELILFCMYRKLLKIERYRTQAMTGKMELWKRKLIYFWKDEWGCCWGLKGKFMRGWGQFIHFDCCLYRNLVKMARGLLWKYFEADLVIVTFRTMNEDGDGGKYKFSWWFEECVYTGKCWKWRGSWWKMARCFDVDFFFEADLFILGF